MPTATNRSVRLYYETAGDGEPVAFVEDVGLGAWLWSWQAPALAGPWRTIVPDTRGTGRSDAPTGPYTVDDLAADLEAVLAACGARSVALVGAGLGGMVALAHALRYGRADRLVLLGTAAAGDRFDARSMVGDPRRTLGSLLSEEFRAARPEAVDQILDWRREDDATAEAAGWQAAAAEGFDVRDRLHEVGQPALVMAGEADAVVPVEAGRALAEGLPRGRFDSYENGAHLFFVEQARLVTDAIAGFLEGD